MKQNLSTLVNAIRGDGWQNILTGLGMADRDKRMSNAPIVQKFAQTELENLYRADDIAQKVVNRIPKEMFRAGYKIKVKNIDDGAEKVTSYFKKLGADECYRKALMLARLHGGSGIVMGIDDGQDASMPVNPAAIRSIKWLSVLDRWRLVYNSIQSDLKLPGYGMPSTYQIQSLNAETLENNTIVHASRVIRFDGVEIPEQAFMSNNYWSDSYLATIYNPLLNFNSAHDGAASTMQDFIQTVYELENLADLIASGDDQLVQKRLALLDATRSIIKAIVIQKGEAFRRDNINISGMPELLSKIESRLVAACNMPHTIVLGEGSEGQTSGNSEKMDFYDTVAQEQVSVLMPKQMELINLICLAKDGPKYNSMDISINYNPLWEPTEQEKAAVYKSNAEADAIYIDRGVIDPIEVTKSRFGQDDSEITVDLIGREEMNTPIAGLEGDNAVTSPDLALNGAQVSSLVEVINGVASGLMPRESALAIIQSAFALPPEIASKIMANIGQGFTPIPQAQPQNSFKTDAIDPNCIQCIFMSKTKFESMDKAAAWISANNYSNASPIESELAFEFVQKLASDFLPGSLIPAEIGEGVKAITGSLMVMPQADSDLLEMANAIRFSL